MLLILIIRFFLILGERPNIIAKLEGHTASINVVTWSPHSGNILMTGASDGTVRVRMNYKYRKIYY